MRIPYLAAVALTFLLCLPVAEAQQLICGASATDTSCALFHYHVRVWNSEAKAWAELYAINRFASLETCETERAAALARSQRTWDIIRKDEPKAAGQAEQLGPCHCDRTREPANSFRTDEAARSGQLAAFAAHRTRVRERLLRANAATASAELYVAPPAPAAIPKTLTSPAVVPHAVAAGSTKESGVAAELAPRPFETDLRLVEIATATTPDVTVETVEVVTTDAEPATGSGAGDVVAAPQPAATADAGTAGGVDEELDPEGTIERFITYETSRVQSILAASSAVSDETLRRRIFETAMERLQLISNLRAVIEAAGPGSRLAQLARTTSNEAARLAFISAVFGGTMRRHWAPTDAVEVVYDVPQEVASDPLGVLRDPSTRFADEQKRQALYVALSRNATLTPAQELWLAGVIDSFLGAAQ